MIRSRSGGRRGDYLCAKYGDLQATPLTLEVRGSRIAGMACVNDRAMRFAAGASRSLI